MDVSTEEFKEVLRALNALVYYEMPHGRSVPSKAWYDAFSIVVKYKHLIEKK